MAIVIAKENPKIVSFTLTQQFLKPATYNYDYSEVTGDDLWILEEEE